MNTFVMSMLFWMGIPVLLLAVGIAVEVYLHKSNPATVSTILIGVFLLIVVCIAWPTGYTSKISQIVEFESIIETIKSVRNEDASRPERSEYERAAIVLRIIKANKWLARNQYWANKAIFDIFYPDRINDLEPIE